MSFLEGLKSVIEQTQIERADEEIERQEELNRKREESQNLLDQERRTLQEKLERLSEIVIPVLEDVGNATWGKNNYEIRRYVTQDKALAWYVSEHRAQDKKYEEYSVVTAETENAFRINYLKATLNVPLERSPLEKGFFKAALKDGQSTLNVPLDRDGLEKGFLKAAREGGPYTALHRDTLPPLDAVPSQIW